MREVLEASAPSGGHALDSEGGVANCIPLGNFLATVDEGWRYRLIGWLEEG